MLKIITATCKELILLKRDRAGLLVLFLMPALLVIVITLVQENVMELTGQKSTQLLLLDLDEGELGINLRQRLAGEQIEIVAWDKQLKTSVDVEKAIATGNYQVGLIIPAGSSVTMREAATQLLQTTVQSGNDQPALRLYLKVFFDPGIMPGLRSGITAQLQMALGAIAMEMKIENLGKEIGKLVTQLGIPQDALPIDNLSEHIGQPLFTLDENRDGAVDSESPPYNPVQQNVPAWALFGMFFTAVPLAGSILQERRSGIWIRLASLPLSHLVLFVGKVIAFVVVCLCQFVLVGLIGAFLFPGIGLPAFSISQNPGAVLLVVFLSSLAACGFGLFLGMACSTYEQASTLGYTAIVASAALGGVMVPVYAMPPLMQELAIISPLNWGLNAFLDILVRGDALSAIWSDLGRLTLFFFLTMLLAWNLVRARK
ncbi:ABC transporter permease [Desulforhopalus sp. IMCC35007]|uniref:ABC transporter permease n=1 Tax=Desulforhopalus sp. IMCC35007 TaxID=2569543 RepID=UPI0010AED53E|nr:ABC transporter permease [Desulforhopalus sp. IMCC35007]TKB10802.1 ABC transporter permease [Desulforhopalus sp. IMCC35007]